MAESEKERLNIMGLFQKLRNIFSGREKRKYPAIEKIKFPDSSYVLLIGFSYDRATKQTYSWIQNILSKSDAKNRVCRFHNKDFRKSDLVAKLDEGLNRVEIFCGHGSNDGLYGPPFNEMSPDILKELHHIIYDTTMQRTGPSSMFAFCCGTAGRFGREFSSLKDNRFIGFNDDIPLADGLYSDLKFIFQTMAKDIIEKGRIEGDHAEFFLKEINSLIEELNRNPNKYALPGLMGSYLVHYRDRFKAFI